ncbi:MAG TPA: DUF1416 domain-containing protein [Streptosporangiaceae bacterium]
MSTAQPAGAAPEAVGAPAGCGAPAGGVAMTAGAAGEAVIEGQVRRDGAPVTTGYARLLDGGGEFVAEVPLGGDGGFRFFAAPGNWTVRALAPGGGGVDETVTAGYGQVTRVELGI